MKRLKIFENFGHVSRDSRTEITGSQIKEFWDLRFASRKIRRRLPKLTGIFIDTEVFKGWAAF
jgi:hypothetical protein